MLVGVLLSAATFGAAAFVASRASAHAPAAGLALQLAGFVVRLTLVALALVVSVRLLGLQALPLGIGLAGGFTVLAVIAAVKELTSRATGANSQLEER